MCTTYTLICEHDRSKPNPIPLPHAKKKKKHEDFKLWGGGNVRYST